VKKVEAPHIKRLKLRTKKDTYVVTALQLLFRRSCSWVCPGSAAA
jgi:hypothetical protein